MENLRILNTGILLLIMLISPLQAHAYAVSTHKNITRTIISEYERLRGATFTKDEQQMIIGGSEHEDARTRPLKHFYDPVHKRGLDVFIGTYPSSITWAQNPVLQNKRMSIFPDTQTRLFEGIDDYSWPRAVHDYVHGDKMRALATLGHILHLAEDLTSVPHTRNDAHSGSWADRSSYYEDYTNGLQPDVTVQSIDRAESVTQIMQSLAVYTNENFLSRDTMFEGFEKPIIDIKMRSQGFITKRGVKLVRVKGYNDKKTGKFILDEITLNNNQVMQSYWQALSEKAVYGGVSLIDLFFREVEKEKQTNELAYMNKSRAEVKSIANAITGFKGAKSLLGSSLSAVDSYELNKEDWEGARKAADIYGIDDFPPRPLGVKMPKRVVEAKSQGASVLLALESGSKVSQEPPSSPAPTPPAPVIIVEPLVPDVEEVREVESIEVVEEAPTPTESTMPEVEPQPVEEAPASNPFDLNLQFGSGMGGGGGSAAPAPEPKPEPVDTIAPTILFEIDSCFYTNAGECSVFPGTEIVYNWSTSDSDLDTFTINDSATTTISTSTEGTATTTLAVSGDSQIITISAIDTEGNTATSTKTIRASIPSVVINEIDWGGTANNPEDEWFELFNNEDYAISLDNWSFIAVDSELTVPLSGTIEAQGYFLVEPDELATSVTADLVTPFNVQMSDTTDTVQLTSGSVIIDEVTPKSGNKWRAGFKNVGQVSHSMERFLPTGPSNDDTNWGSASHYWHPATDRDGAVLYGTPKARNSTNYLFTYDNEMNTDELTIDASRSPYKLPYFTISSGKKLIIQDGVTIEMFTEPHPALDVQGMLEVVGTAASPVIFTSDSLNAGAWKGITVNGGADATITYGQILYGGYSGGSTDAGVKVSGGTITLNNTTITDSGAFGLRAESGATVTITDSTISNSVGHGLSAKASTVIVDNTVFESNDIGVYDSHLSDITVRDSTFSDNTERAIYHGSDKPAVYSGNGGSGNGLDGIFLGGSWMNSTGSTTLTYNSLPYVFSWLDIKGGTTLSVDAGVTMQGTYSGSAFGGKAKMTIQDGGVLNLSGTESNPVLFTSIKDPNDGPSEGDWWGIVTEGTASVIGASTSTAKMRYADITTPVLW